MGEGYSSEGEPMSKREKKFDAVVRVTFDVKLCDVNEASLESAVNDFQFMNGLSRSSHKSGYIGPRTRSGHPASSAPEHQVCYSYDTPLPTVEVVSKKARK